MRTLGTCDNEIPKVPTLRQAIKSRLDLPPRNLVTLIFKPGKYSVITLQCEELFRVNVREEEPLFRDMLGILDALSNEKTALFIEIPNGSQGKFTILIDDDSKSDWDEFDWGFRLAEHDKRSKRAGKEPRATLKKA